MKIGFDAKRIFHNFRGLGNYGRNLLEGLEKFYPESDYHLFSPKFKDSRALDWARKHSTFKIHSPNTIISKSMQSLWRSSLMTRDISREGMSIFHGLSHELPLGIEKTNVKSVVTIHDLIYLKFPEYFPWIDRKVYDKKFRHSCNVADSVVAICEQTRNDLLEHFNLSPDKVVVKYQSCHHRFYKTLDQDKKNEVLNFYSLPSEYLLFVGAIEKRKNVLGLVRALATAKTDLPLVIVGDGNSESKKELIETIDALGLTSRVYIRSNIISKHLPAIYQSAAIFVFPSFYEGFGIPIIEAQFSEVPVITSIGSCFPETAGEGAIFINPHHNDELAHAIDKLCFDSDLARNLVHLGRKHVEKFHRSNTTREMMNLYESLI